MRLILMRSPAGDHMVVFAGKIKGDENGAQGRVWPRYKLHTGFDGLGLFRRFPLVKGIMSLRIVDTAQDIVPLPSLAEPA